MGEGMLGDPSSSKGTQQRQNTAGAALEDEEEDFGL